jgi:hypothetical protein
MRRENRSQRGSILPLVALAMVVAGGGALLLGRIGEGAVSRAAARAAADAAALAGAAEGEKVAREVAEANGATVVRYETVGQDTRVTVRLGSAEAVGRARQGDPAAKSGP